MGTRGEYYTVIESVFTVTQNHGNSKFYSRCKKNNQNNDKKKKKKERTKTSFLKNKNWQK